MSAADVVGDYEFIRPGSACKSTQTLSLKEDGTCTYTEVGGTSMENFTSEGEGTWTCEGGVVQVMLSELRKEMHFKMKTMVPGIEDGTSVKTNVAIPLTYDELANAPGHGTNKWRKRSG